ncbi:unnamed protein product [Mytilus coruscus]|uniref:UMOD/GP2/OIT3-like D8C domain-containing protein n=1 Tax=Mytilus coruscus TaxID=42192 RepID=A0A6J8D1D1_MYTCO|nr:unnamed protein product [Mytilus coruscus]
MNNLVDEKYTMKHCVIVLLIIPFAKALEPCSDYSTITNEENRSPFHQNSFSDTPISDDRLTPGWYRIEMNTGSLIPNQIPELFRCGTWNPIWLNGTLPSVPEVRVNGQVCVNTFNSVCEYTWFINIKFCCGNYLVYELLSSPVEKSAYCFGNSSNGFVSSKDNTIGCYIVLIRMT